MEMLFSVIYVNCKITIYISYNERHVQCYGMKI